MERCPTCKAKLAGSVAQCPRCRSELSRLWMLEARGSRHFRCAVAALLHDKESLAAWAVTESLRLKRDPVAVAMRGFLRRRRERQALRLFIAGDEHRARDALAAAVALGSRNFAAALRGFFVDRG